MLKLAIIDLYDSMFAVIVWLTNLSEKYGPMMAPAQYQYQTECIKQPYILLTVVSSQIHSEEVLIAEDDMSTKDTFSEWYDYGDRCSNITKIFLN